MKAAVRHVNVTVDVSSVQVSKGCFAQLSAQPEDVTVELRHLEDGTVEIFTNRPDLVRDFSEWSTK